ncbi:uncharacterized protein N7469_006241 [Penicillium citrinum]|uniref:Tautomerase cis-CaaD-like domain-containing protein n=2 Tax=Penicillium TaxID=5073 RepID=A0A9W9TMJ9_PENCI|nr:uncharacterized protein N7469_006241 [Penicillium citrinum]KAJ5231653.1 hypothetical protein N7469_006241 [Penicillium citrinum]KAJ5579182.1 hypothetical protein N7450_008049 [Penicillium hetheringtonii]
MPLYDVEYVCPLTCAQQEALAEAFTNLHAKRFNTPRYFVNVRFTDASNQVVFRGGHRRKYNRVILRTRAGSNRTNESYIEHCRAIAAEWEQIVGNEDDESLRTIWVMGALTTALEAGLARPKTGEEDDWLEANKAQFKKLAEGGDEDFIELMKELESD